MAAGSGEVGAGAGTDGSAGVEEGGDWVPISEEARLVLFFGRLSRLEWARKAACSIAWDGRTIGAEEARAVAVKSWTGDARMSCRYGRDLVPSRTPLRTLLDCTDVMLVVAECLGLGGWRKRIARFAGAASLLMQQEEGMQACLCLGAYGGHRAMVEVASSALYGSVGVSQSRLTAQCA